MNDYKDTLNLPHTEFPMRANLANREPATLDFWAKNDLYGKMREARLDAEKFIVHDGPPYANGNLHCGHALNKILKDMVVKSQALNGKDTPFVPGWDCHGLPIELNVEKKWGKAGVKLTPTEFRQKCREYAMTQIDIQREEFKRLGVLGDWGKPYVTMDYHYEANTIRALGKIIENGYLVRGSKPVHWCLDCQSALAEAEVEYEDKQSPAIDVAFFVSDTQAFSQHFQNVATDKAAFVIWTTTPWTLPANEAVALHPELAYVLVKSEAGNWIIAEDLVEKTLMRYGIEKYTVSEPVEGKVFEGLMLNHPLDSEKQVPVVLGEHVTTDAGTGCVHTAPTHGPDDYLIGQKYQLPMNCPVLGSGVYASWVKDFAGIFVAKADNAIMDALDAKGTLVYRAIVNHSYPHCWRHKTPVIFRATPQWFLTFNKEGIQEALEQAIDNVQWVPEWGNGRMKKMMENRPDWCISRQRSWGTPITLLIHKETGELHPRTQDIIKEVSHEVEKIGIEAWFAWNPETFLGEEAKDYEKVTDTLDVWFDSGVSHACVLRERPELSHPADVYLEGSDQYRGWFNSSLVTGVMLDNKAPYKTVVSHGFTIDAQGRKMSKSLGNTIEPQEIIKTLGADVLRLWVASSDYRTELAISHEIFNRVSDAYRRIRNTTRFLLSNLFDFEPKNLVPVSNLVALDQWIVSKAWELQKEIREAYDAFQFHVVYQKLHHFCSIELGSFYLDIIKDRQYTSKADCLARRSCQTAMHHILSAMVRWMAPILSFTSEEIWQNAPYLKEQNESVFLNTWYEDESFRDIQECANDIQALNWDWVLSVREGVNKELEAARSAQKIGSSLEASVIFYVNDDMREKMQKLGQEWRFVLLTSKVMFKELALKTTQAVALDESDTIWVEVLALDAPKCTRCWHRREDIGINSNHPEICLRCVENVEGDGESREFA